MSAAKILLAILALFLAASASGVKLQDEFRQPDSAAESTRSEPGERVRQSYARFAERLKSHAALLARALAREPRDPFGLVEPATPLAPGYQMLPKIVRDVAPRAPRPPLESSQYSWPATERLIENAMAELAHAEEELRESARLALGARQKSHERLAQTYRRLREREQMIAAHIQYNRFWQSDIATRRASYDRWTVLHDAVLERQALRDWLALLDTEWIKKTLAILEQFSHRLSGLKDRLAQREKSLDRMVDAAVDDLTVPGFVGLERQPGAWVIRVPLYTDIHDADFVASVKKEVESIWRLRNGREEFRVVLTESFLPAPRLYADSAPPTRGDRIDLQRHLARFPRDGAILTTGAGTTHVSGRAVILGPEQISPRLLAHEFGHILGFKDRYFRGYRDLGEDGFQILEVIASHSDIMGSPASGEVRHGQFMRLLQALLVKVDF
jgi:hypothetical protein